MSRAKVAVSLEEATLGRLDDVVRNAVFPSRSQAQKAGFPLTLELQGKNLPKRSWVKIIQIRTLAVERVGRSLGRVAPRAFVGCRAFVSFSATMAMAAETRSFPRLGHQNVMTPGNARVLL